MNTEPNTPEWSGRLDDPQTYTDSSGTIRWKANLGRVTPDALHIAKPSPLAALLHERTAPPAEPQEAPICEHVYSKSMDQEYPRKCVKCGERESPIMVKVVRKQQFQQALPCFPVPLPAQQFLDRHNIMFAAALEKVIKKLISQGAKNVTVKWVNRPSFPSDSENERARNFAFWIHAERDFEFFAPEDEV